MSDTRWLVVVGSVLNLGAAALAFDSGNFVAGVVLVGATIAWMLWAFWRDRG